MTPALRLAIAQMSPGPDPIDNARTIDALAQDASARGARVVVFPEYAHAFIPGDGPAMAARAEPLAGDFVSELAAISDRHRVIIIAGALIRSDCVRNTILAVGSEGVMAQAEKIHLYDAFGMEESAWVAPGRIDQPQVLELDGHRLGLLACYDLRFAEVSRRLVDHGATTLVVPAQWVPGEHKLEHWRVLLRARAIENQCFVVASGHPAPHGVGHSQVVSPLGEVLLERADGVGVDLATLDAGDVTAARDANPMAAVRRFQVTPRGGA